MADVTRILKHRYCQNLALWWRCCSRSELVPYASLNPNRLKHHPWSTFPIRVPTYANWLYWTRMHSSRMRTARFSGRLPGERVSAQRVSTRRCLPRGGGGLPEGMSEQGGVYHTSCPIACCDTPLCPLHAGIPPPPHVNRMTDVKTSCGQ